MYGFFRMFGERTILGGWSAGAGVIPPLLGFARAWSADDEAAAAGIRITVEVTMVVSCGVSWTCGICSSAPHTNFFG